MPGVIERPDHDVHRLGHEGVRESAKLPIAEMGGREKDPAAGLLGLEIVLQAFVTNPLRNVLAIELGKTREDPDEARDGAENFVGDGAALRQRFFGIGQFEIAHRGAAQAGNRKIGQSDVEAG